MSENNSVARSGEPRFDEISRSSLSPPCRLLELHRRCFSCLSVVLGQEALLSQGSERTLLLEQPGFAGHALTKTIMGRVSDQIYADISGFVDDVKNLVNMCIAQCDQGAVVGALMAHVAKTGQPDCQRAEKTTFHGFPHPLLEEMLAQTAAMRKKMPLSKAHATVDVGKYLARAYGLGLTSGAQFVGQPSKEMVFYAQRKEREVEWINAVNAEAAAAASKAQKRSRAKERGVDGPKKKPKLQSPVARAMVTPKPTRSLRGTRRAVLEDSTDVSPRLDAPNGLPDRKAKDIAAQRPDAAERKPRATGVPRRVLHREKMQCHHLQGREVEMADVDVDPPTGFGFRGTVQGTAIVCHCGCRTTMKGVHWLLHNGGRANNRQPGYPWKYMKLVEGERLEDHWPQCDCHQHLCDSCHAWEEPSLPMTKCWKCQTSVHAAEACAARISEKVTTARLKSTHEADVATPPTSRSRPARRKAAVRVKAGASGSKDHVQQDSDNNSNEDERDAEDSNAGEWICQVCSGERAERETLSCKRRRRRT